MERLREQFESAFALLSGLTLEQAHVAFVPTSDVA